MILSPHLQWRPRTGFSPVSLDKQDGGQPDYNKKPCMCLHIFAKPIMMHFHFLSLISDLTNEKKQNLRKESHPQNPQKQPL